MATSKEDLKTRVKRFTDGLAVLSAEPETALDSGALEALRAEEKLYWAKGICF